jgi:hypothetical protein
VAVRAADQLKNYGGQVLSYPLRGLLLRAGSRHYKYCWATAPYYYFYFFTLGLFYGFGIVVAGLADIAKFAIGGGFVNCALFPPFRLGFTHVALKQSITFGYPKKISLCYYLLMPLIAGRFCGGRFSLLVALICCTVATWLF